MGQQKRYDKLKSQAIKDYYERLRVSTGKSQKSIAEAIGITPVSLSNLSYRLDQMTVEKLTLLSKQLGVNPGDFLLKINNLRKESNDVGA